MIVAVASYLVLVSFLTWAAAWAAEGASSKVGVSSRWVWLLAMATPYLLLLAPLLTPAANVGTVGGSGGASFVYRLPEMVVGDGAVVSSWSPLLGAAWIVASVTLGAFLLTAHRRLDIARRGWEQATVAGARVYVSPDHGPAVAGIVRPWIVLPRWALALPDSELERVVLHEREHLQARDTALLGVGLALVVATPWNPFSWLQLRGLKAAMELDCDRRVLRRAPDRRAYGESLLVVAARSRGLSLGLAAFTERGRSLERRIRAMTDRPTRWTPLRAALLAALAVVVGLQACYVDSPVLIFGGDGEVEVVRVPGDDGATEAVVVRPRQPQSDGEPRSEGPAEADRPIPQPEPTVEPSRPDLGEPPPVAPEAPLRPEPAETARLDELEEEPTFTPFTVAPRIANREEVVRAMEAEYPPLLREAGIGGRVEVWFLIDAEGRVRNTRIGSSSGHQALDLAAIRVADAFSFVPALNREEPVPVWVSLPITFQAR